MDTDNVAIRLKGFIQSQGLTNSQFADNCGIPRPSLSQLLGGRNKKISDVIVGQIHKAYPELSVLWLMFGEGKMMVDNREPEVPKPQADRNIGQEGIMSPDLFADDAELLNNESDAENYRNVKPLNMPQQTIKQPDIQAESVNKKTMELMQQIEKMKKNPRKVSQITIYYDDSTFETFYPKR